MSSPSRRPSATAPATRRSAISTATASTTSSSTWPAAAATTARTATTDAALARRLQARRHAAVADQSGHATSARAPTTRSSWSTTSTATAAPKSPARRPTARSTARARRSATPTPTTSTRNGRILDGPEFLTVFDGHDRRGAGHDRLHPAARRRRRLGRRLRQPRRSLPRLHRLSRRRAAQPRHVPRLLHPRRARRLELARRQAHARLDLRQRRRHARQPTTTAARATTTSASADVDDDGRDEIVYGSCVIDDNGNGLYSTGLGHGDAMHVTDLDPEQPGPGSLQGQRRRRAARPASRCATPAPASSSGACPAPGRDGVGRACAIDIDPRHSRLGDAGAQGEGVGGLYNAKGETASPTAPRGSATWASGGTATCSRELLDGVDVSKWDYEQRPRRRRCFSGARSRRRLEQRLEVEPVPVRRHPRRLARGDRRRQRATAGRSRIFTTTIPTEHRFATLMHDPLYRLGVAWQNVAYNQPAHTSFYLGAPAPR